MSVYDDGQGDVEASSAVLRLRKISTSPVSGASLCYTCSRPRLEAFGGGARIIDPGAQKYRLDQHHE